MENFVLISEPYTSKLWISCEESEQQATLSVVSSKIGNTDQKITYALKSIEDLPQLDIAKPSTLDNQQHPISKRTIGQLIDRLRDQFRIKKTVLAFTQDKTQVSLDVMQSFARYRKVYPHCLTFLVAQQEQLWLGASPELILIKSGEHIQSRALAGTIDKEDTWTTKEIEEQAIVSEEIQQLFKDNQVKEIQVVPQQDFVMGKIKHLSTQISGKVDSTEQAETLSEQLHPTSALSGFPRASALELLSDIEPFNRQLYTGMIRRQDKNQMQSYAMLRCVKISKNSLRVYVGAGITPQSSVDKEYNEYHKKIDTILDGLIFDTL